MALCPQLTQDILFNCDTGSGGVGKEMYIIEQENIDILTESSGTITAIAKLSGKIFRKYQLVQETATFDETISGNIQNGTLFYDQKGTIVLNKQNVLVRNEILILATQRLVIIIQDNNTTYRLFGRNQGLKLSNGTAGTGTSFGDRNGYSLDFTGKEPELAPFVLSSVIATLQT